MAFYKIRQKIGRIYRTVRESIGSPASLVRLIPLSWLEEHAAFQNEINANRAAQSKNNYLKDQVAKAVSYATEIEAKARKAVQEKDDTINGLTARVQEMDNQIKSMEELAANTNEQLVHARHWKYDIARAGRALLQTRAELEALQTRKSVVIAADHNDRIVHASQRALKLLGYVELSQIEKTDVYNLLRGTDGKSSEQIRKTIQTDITQTRPEKVSLSDALLIRSQTKRPVRANLTIIPIYAGTTYIGSVIRGESSDEKQARLKAKATKQAEEKKVRDAEAARSIGIVARASNWLRKIKPQTEISPD